MEIYIALLALLGTFYQLHLQRVHNEKSLTALPQIDILDRKNTISIHIQNNGVGPLIVDKLLFHKAGKTFTSIVDAVELEKKTYFSITIEDSNKKTILPAHSLEVFSTSFDDNYPKEKVSFIREQLSQLTLEMVGFDIYKNKVSATRDLKWFARK